MGSWYYNYSGLRIASAIELPEWIGFALSQPFDAPDVIFALTRFAPAEMAEMERESLCRPGLFRFYIGDAGYYCVRDGKEITVQPAPGAHMRETRLFLLGTAWGALCYQRGLLPLHGAVVRVDGAGAVAICGASGAGKSTCAAWLSQHGYPLLSDDLALCDQATQTPRIWPSANRFKLWTDTLDALGLQSDQIERDHFRIDKFHLAAQGSWATQPLELRAIYLLEWGDLSISPLRGYVALQRFVNSATYRAELLQPLGQLAQHWARCLRLVSSVPVWEFRRPPDWAALDAAMTTLLHHWA